MKKLLKILLPVLVFSGVARGDAVPLQGGAILVNGSYNLQDTYANFFKNLNQARSLFSGWKQDVYSFNGNVPADVMNAISDDKDGQPRYDESGEPVLVHIDVPGAKPAEFDRVKRGILEMAKTLPAGQPMVLFFTDHGTPGKTVLYGGHDLSVDEMREILNAIPADRKVTVIHDHCYSGSMLEALFSNGKIRANACGFSLAAPNEMGTVGNTLMDHMTKAGPEVDSFGSLVHDMLYNQEMDSTPMTSSDLFVEKYLASHPSAEEKGAPRGSVAMCISNPNLATDLTNLLKESSAVLAKVQLRSELARLQRDVAKASALAGMKKVESYKEVLDSLEKLAQEIDKADNLSDEVSAKARSARIAYIKHQVGEKNWNRYSLLDSELDHLRQALEKAESPLERKQLREQIDTLRPEYVRLEMRVEATSAGALNGSKAYLQFVRENAQAGGWDPNIAKEDQEAESTDANLMTKQIQLKRLALAMKKVTALDAMVKAGDSKSLQTYMEILECENTPVRTRAAK